MKKLLTKSLIFLLYFIFFFLLINSIYLLVIVKTDYDFRKRLETLSFNNPDFKLIVLGASTSLDGFDTEMLTLKGIRSYNMAIGGATVKTNYLQLKEYLSKYSNRPDYVFLGLNSAMVKSFDDELIHPIVEVTMQNYRFNIMDVPILKFKWLGFEFLKKVVSKTHREAQLSYGQVKFRKAITDKSCLNTSYLDIKEFESSQWIGEIAKLCNEWGINLIVIEMPGYASTRNLSDKGPYTLKFRNGYSASFYNYNSSDFCKIFQADKDWVGNSHLNEFGAEKFTKELLNIIDN